MLPNAIINFVAAGFNAAIGSFAIWFVTNDSIIRKLFWRNLFHLDDLKHDLTLIAVLGGFMIAVSLFGVIPEGIKHLKKWKAAKNEQ